MRRRPTSSFPPRRERQRCLRRMVGPKGRFGFYFSSQILVASESDPLATPEPSTLFPCCLGLAEAKFDSWIEERCQPYYAEKLGRPSIPPGVYFRMILVGYFEGIASQRGIAWRCSDSRSLAVFLGIPINERTPDHSSLSRVHGRLPLEVHEEVFSCLS